MDSLTQLVLGAAVGEAILGKKIGNKAIFWGAVAGTIPDLDVLANLFMSPLDALTFHRGLTHSLLYLTILSMPLGVMVHRLYKYPNHHIVSKIWWVLFFTCIAAGVMYSTKNIFFTSVSVLPLLMYIYINFFRKKLSVTLEDDDTSVKDWVLLFFGALITHPILDCFTTYGTQILQPFSDFRVAFNNIAVADPMYTLPFALCLLIASFLQRTSRSRKLWNSAGLIWSCAYMLFTIGNKFVINRVFLDTLDEEALQYERFMTTPTILNNVLWSGIAETKDSFYFGLYSHMDKSKKFKLNSIPKTKDSILKTHEGYTLDKLRWFSDNYFILSETSTDTLDYFDLRFGTFRANAQSEDKFVFKFVLVKDDEKGLYLINQGESPKDANFAEAFSLLWQRIQGKIE